MTSFGFCRAGGEGKLACEEGGLGVGGMMGPITEDAAVRAAEKSRG